jgi:hypothetical protein
MSHSELLRDPKPLTLPVLAGLRAFICLSHYGTQNAPFLRQVLAEWDRMPFATLDVVLLCTHPPELPPFQRLRIETRQFPVDIRKGLPGQHRAIMADRLGKYDLYVYTEDDILISELNVRTFLALSARLPDSHVPGFLVYEQSDAMPDPVYVETWIKGHHYPPVGRKRVFGDLTVRLMGNPHQCCYLMTGAHFARIMHTRPNEYLCRCRQIPPRAGWKTIFGGFGPLESAASDIFTNGGLTRVCWLDDLPAISIRHLPNRYLSLMEKAIARHELMRPPDFLEPAIARWARFDVTPWSLYWWCRYGLMGLFLRTLARLGIAFPFRSLK